MAISPRLAHERYNVGTGEGQLDFSKIPTREARRMAYYNKIKPYDTTSARTYNLDNWFKQASDKFYGKTPGYLEDMYINKIGNLYDPNYQRGGYKPQRGQTQQRGNQAGRDKAYINYIRGSVY